MSRDSANSVTVAEKMNMAGSLASHTHTYQVSRRQTNQGIPGLELLFKCLNYFACVLVEVRIQNSPSTMWIPGVETGSLSLVLSTFITEPSTAILVHHPLR